MNFITVITVVVAKVGGIFKAMKMIVVRNKETDNFQELETIITGAGCSQ